MEIHRLPHLQASGQARPQSRNIKKIQRNSMGPRLASRSKTSPAIEILRKKQQILLKSSANLADSWKIFQILALSLKNLPNPCSELENLPNPCSEIEQSSKSSLRDCSAAARLASGGSGSTGPARAPKTLQNHENHVKSTFNCTKYTQMGPNYFTIVFCVSMHYFVMVSYTSMVPFQIYLRFFVEF